jgi:chromosomal replication initiation ATPase DnaA
MQELAKIENEKAKRNWDRSRSKIRKELSVIFKWTAPRAAQRLRMSLIIQAVCDETGVPDHEILGRGRVKEIARARQYAMWKCRQQGYSFPEIARVFDRDHTTIVHGCRVIDGIISRNKAQEATQLPPKKDFGRKSSSGPFLTLCGPARNSTRRAGASRQR